MEICGPPSPPLRAAWKSLLKSETARMLPISVVHGQIDDERHLTCYFGMLFPTGRSFESRRPVGGGNTSRALRLRVAQAQGAARGSRLSCASARPGARAASECLAAGSEPRGGRCRAARTRHAVCGRIHVDASAPRA